MFIGRKKELEKLQGLSGKETASLVVIKGRRRIGKSFLVRHFGKSFPTYLEFSGLPPEHNATAEDQREEFARQLQRQVKIPALKADDWGDLFWHLGEKVQKGRVLIFLDEIAWMGKGDPLFLGKLKNAWDLYFSKNPKLILVLCASVSGWIDKNILSSTGFMGRISLNLTLEELPLKDCTLFFGKNHRRISSHEKFKILSITGGVPRYLAEIESTVSSEENIRRWCFTKGGILVDEFDHIFSDLFERRTLAYKKIVSALVKGPQERHQLLKNIHSEKGGVISDYLDDLEKAGFLSKDFTWDFTKASPSPKLARYRLKDNYLRFYLKYIEPHLTRISKGQFNFESLHFLPAWETVMGLQFENLVLNNRFLIFEKLSLSPSDVVNDNPFFQKKNLTQPGCQIDYLIQDRFNTLYVCEIKFSKNQIGKEVIREVSEKLKRLKTPRNFTLRPVLIHAGYVEDSVIESRFFDKIINFSDFISES